MSMYLKATLLASAMAVAVPGTVLAANAAGETAASSTHGDQSAGPSGSTHTNGRETAQGYLLAQAGAPQQEAIGYSVRNAQRMLSQLGYDAGLEDGVMGPRTRSAIRAYQRDKAMDANGRLTRDLFGSLSADHGRGGAVERLRDLRERLPEESRQGIDRAIEGGSLGQDRAQDGPDGRPGSADPHKGRGGTGGGGKPSGKGGG